MHEEHEEREEKRIYNKLIAKDSLYVSKIFDPFFSQIEVYLVFESKSHYHNSNQQSFKEIELEDYSFVITRNCTTH